MIIVEGFAFDGVLGVVHPDLADSGEFQEALLNHSAVVAGETGTGSTEEYLPAAILNFALFVGLCHKVGEVTPFQGRCYYRLGREDMANTKRITTLARCSKTFDVKEQKNDLSIS